MSDPYPTTGGTGPSGTDRLSDTDRLKDRAGTEAQAARREGEGARDHLKAEGHAFQERARETAYEGADRAKHEVSSSLDDFAAAVRKASDELGQRDQSMASHLVREVAGGLEQASRSIGGRDVGEITHSVARFARERPGVFMAGMALAGLALGRFVRASGDHDPSRNDHRTDDGFAGSSPSSRVGTGPDERSVRSGAATAEPVTTPEAPVAAYSERPGSGVTGAAPMPRSPSPTTGPTNGPIPVDPTTPGQAHPGPAEQRSTPATPGTDIPTGGRYER
ncbi:MAG: hypothetical protein VYD57_09050 [Pseudomonadota bacterium]|nr:hypothetical protein [Pseudomonadota bacterium]